MSDNPERLPYHTQPIPSYTLPYYGASDSTLLTLNGSEVKAALKAYGGLIRPRDSVLTLRTRLQSLTADAYRKRQLTMRGVVTSDKMQKSVVVACKRPAWSEKYQKAYFRTRRFMAHDELELCKEGDDVVIRSCRPMSRRKKWVVVVNYGDGRVAKGEGDGREEKLHEFYGDLVNKMDGKDVSEEVPVKDE